eukprot:PhF_6_TR38107/c0_g1_i2/m.56868
MPMFMDEITAEEAATNPDVQGIQAMLDEFTPEEKAENAKKSGNNNLSIGLQNGNKHLFSSAIEFYTQGLQAGSANRRTNMLLYSNRSQANLYLENNASALKDAERAILLDPSYVKNYYRAAQAAIGMMHAELALKFVEEGLALPGENSNPELRSIVEKAERAIRAKKESVAREIKKKQAMLKSETTTRKVLRELGIKSGPPETTSEHWNVLSADAFTKLSKGTGNIASRVIEFPVLFLYDEYSQTDFIEKADWTTTFLEQLSEMFPPQGERPPWDEHGRYVVPKLAIFYHNVITGKYVRVDPKSTLQRVLQSESYVLPGMLP